MYVALAVQRLVGGVGRVAVDHLAGQLLDGSRHVQDVAVVGQDLQRLHGRRGDGTFGCGRGEQAQRVRESNGMVPNVVIGRQGSQDRVVDGMQHLLDGSKTSRHEPVFEGFQLQADIACRAAVGCVLFWRAGDRCGSNGTASSRNWSSWLVSPEKKVAKMFRVIDAGRDSDPLCLVLPDVASPYSSSRRGRSNRKAGRISVAGGWLS